jgi:hypothetical protein
VSEKSSAVRIGNVVAGAFDTSLAGWEQHFARICGDVGAMLTFLGWLVPTIPAAPAGRAGVGPG